MIFYIGPLSIQLFLSYIKYILPIQVMTNISLNFLIPTDFLLLFNLKSYLKDFNNDWFVLGDFITIYFILSYVSCSKRQVS